MLVVIAGAGAVGQYLLESFNDRDIDLILIEKDENKLNQVKEKYDALGVEGDMLSHFILRKANVAMTDIFIACSNVDSVNILSCQMAKRLGAKKCIARVYSDDIFPYEIADLESHLGVDWLVSPSRLTGYKIAYSMFDTENIVFDNYFANRLDIAKLKIRENDDIIIEKIKSWIGKKINFVTAYRDNKLLHVDPKKLKDFIPQKDDLIIISGTQNALPKKLIELSEHKSKKEEKIYFAGTSKSALSSLSLMNKKRKNIVVLEGNLEKAKEVEEKYEISVINVDPGIFKNLKNLNLDNEGIFVCASDDDAENLTYALNALDLNFKSIIPIVQSKERIRFFERMHFNQIISPCELAAKEIFRYYKESINEDFLLVKGAPTKAFIYEITEKSHLLNQTWTDWQNDEVITISSCRKGHIFLHGDKDYKSSQVGDKILFASVDGNEKKIRSFLTPD